MSFQFALAGIALLLMGGCTALGFRGSPRQANLVGAATAAVGSFMLLVEPLLVLGGQPGWDIRERWSLPFGEFHLGLDSLSALFLLAIGLVSSLAAVYGYGYLSMEKNGRVASSWFFYCALVASMALTVLARDGVLFLLAWEMMAIASFFLVAYEHEKEEVRNAAWVYLVATHLGTAFLLAFFALAARESGSFDFDRMTGAGGSAPGYASLLFALALIGFGTKAGLVPLHVWLPEAHPAAPSHVSALMSGVMIKTGIYGLFRALTFLGPPPASWGAVLIVFGLTSGILGVLLALAQHDLKRLLAYHSVENIGIIILGMGAGLLGLSYGIPALAVLGFAGALLHVFNHAIFKSLLFMAAGSVARATGTREIDRLGGLIKRMRWTGATFLVGSAAISGIPPLNGFVSEFLIFSGAFGAGGSLSLEAALPLIAVIGGLALIGGLAVACFTKASGIAFLGEPRSAEAAAAREAPGSMSVPMVILALACLAGGLLSPFYLPGLAPAVSTASGIPPSQASALLVSAADPLTSFLVAAAVFALLAGLLASARARAVSRHPSRQAVTWDCGYAAPTARMQYTSSSFAAPLTDLFSSVLKGRIDVAISPGPFPTNGLLSSHTPDPFSSRTYAPFFRRVEKALGRLRPLQAGRVQLYVLYVALTLLVLLVWEVAST